MAWNWDRDYKGDTPANSYRTEPAAPAADAGMEDFLASAKKLTDQFLEKSRRQAEQMLREASGQADRIVAEARRQAAQLVQDAENRAEEISLRAHREADELVEQARAEAEQIRRDAIPAGSIDQEYAIQCVSDCFDEIRRRQEESMDLLNAQWQKILIDLMPSDDSLPTPEPLPESEPLPAPSAEANLVQPAPAPAAEPFAVQPLPMPAEEEYAAQYVPEPEFEEDAPAAEASLPDDLEAKVSALSREMDELFRNR